MKKVAHWFFVSLVALNLLGVVANILCIFALIPGTTGDSPAINVMAAIANLAAAAYCAWVAGEISATAQHPTPAKESDE